jgi:hypothetical protein
VQAAADQASTSPPCPLRLRPNRRLFLVGEALRCSWCTTVSVRCEVVARHVGQLQPSTEGGIGEEGEAGAEANARSSTIFFDLNLLQISFSDLDLAIFPIQIPR